MKNSVSKDKREHVKQLEDRVKELRAALAKVQKTHLANESLHVVLKKGQKRAKKIRIPDGPDEGIGEFFLVLEITASLETVYIPLSIASGKKTTGFVYQIEGTSQGTIGTTDISCTGDGVTQVTLGTILYAKIPKGVKATFRIRIEIRGRVHHTYNIIIHRIHFKHSPSEARYTKFEKEIRTELLKFE